MADRIITLRQVRSFDQVMSTTFLMFRSSFRPLIQCLLSISGPWMLVAVVLTSTLIAVGEGSDAFGITMFGAFASVLLICIAALLCVTSIYAFIVLYAQAQDEPPSVGAVWRKTQKLVWKVFGTVLTLIFIGGILLTILSLVTDLGYAIIGSSVAGTIIFSLAVLAFIVYCTVYFSFTFIIRVQEPVGTFGAISRSFDLIQGYWWQTFGILFLMYIILFGISYSLTVLPYTAISIQGAFTESGTGLFTTVLTVLWAIVSVFIFTMAFTLYTIAIAIQYYSLVERMDAPGLRERVHRLERSIQPPV